MVQPVSTFDPLMASRPTMSFEEQKILGRFIRLGPLRFIGAAGDDTHEFLVSC